MLYLGFDVLFGEYVQEASSQIRNDENVRIYTYPFFIDKIFENPLTFFFGSGHPEVAGRWAQFYHFYASDIGIVGAWFTYGFFWVVIYFVQLYIILYKYRHVVPTYLKLYVISSLITSPMIFAYRNPIENIVWAILLYQAAMSIKMGISRKRLIKKNNKEWHIQYYSSTSSLMPSSSAGNSAKTDGSSLRSPP